MNLLPSLWWTVGTVGAAIMIFFGSRRLAWQLFLFVPLAGELVIVLCPVADPKLSFSIPLLAQPLFWVGIGFMYIYGLVMFGGWPILLGELGWMIVSSSSLPKKLSLQILAPTASATGGLVGYIIVIWWHALFLGQTFFPSPQVWASAFQKFWAEGFSIAGLAGGMLGGILVAYNSESSANSSKASMRLSPTVNK